MEQNYKKLYLEYKANYLELKNASGGMFPIQTTVSQSERKKARKEAERARKREQEEAAAASRRQLDIDRAESKSYEEELLKLKSIIKGEGDEILSLIYDSINTNLNNFNWFSKDFKESKDLLNTLALRIHRFTKAPKAKTPKDRVMFDYVLKKLNDRRERLRRLSALYEIKQSERGRPMAESVSQILRGSEPEASQLLMDSLQQQPMAPQDRARVIQPRQIQENIDALKILQSREKYVSPTQARKQRVLAREEREEDQRLYGPSYDPFNH